MEYEIYLAGVIISFISLLTTTCVIVLHFKYPKFRKHPGQYVLVQCICQFIYDLHWCISYPQFNLYHQIECLCPLEAFFLTTSFNLGILYVTILGIELCVKFKFRGSISYFKRSLLYNSVSIFIAIVIDVILAFDGKFYVSEFNTCSVESRITDFFEICICLGCTVIMVFSLSYMICKKNRNSAKLIKNFALIIFFFILTWIFPSCIAFYEKYISETYMKNIGYILGTLSGTCIGLSRMINYKVVRFVRRRVTLKKGRRNERKTFNLEKIHDSLNDSFYSRAHSYTNFGELYDDLSIKTVIDIICTLGLLFYEKEESLGFNSKNFKYTKGHLIERVNHKFIIHSKRIILTEYESEAFEMIRMKYSHHSRDIHDDPDNYDFLQTNLIINNSSGSMIFITFDQRYVIKIISKHERSVFFEVLFEKYINRLLSSPESKLVRILGLYQIKPVRTYFMIMENTCCLNDNCLRFDLKGSTADRFVRECDSTRAILKDINFIKSNVRVELDESEYSSVINTLKQDFKLLKSVGIMDYSIYLVYYADEVSFIYPHYKVGNCSVSVIDLFQLYDSQKAIERFWKIYLRCLEKHCLSSVTSNEYYERIKRFLPKIFIPSKRSLS